MDLAPLGEEVKLAYISIDLSEEEEYQDVFAWLNKDLKGVDP